MCIDAHTHTLSHTHEHAHMPMHGKRTDRAKLPQIQSLHSQDTHMHTKRSSPGPPLQMKNKSSQFPQVEVGHLVVDGTGTQTTSPARLSLLHGPLHTPADAHHHSNSAYGHGCTHKHKVFPGITFSASTFTLHSIFSF